VAVPQPHPPGGLLARKSFECEQFHDGAQPRVDGRQPLERILDHLQRVGGGHGSGIVRELYLVGASGKRPRMVDQQPLHQVCREVEEGLLLLPGILIRAAKCLDFHQFQVELVDQCGRMPGVVGALAPHARGHQTAQFGIEEFPGGRSVAARTGDIVTLVDLTDRTVAGASLPMGVCPVLGGAGDRAASPACRPTRGRGRAGGSPGRRLKPIVCPTQLHPRNSAHCGIQTIALAPDPGQTPAPCDWYN
jgi:hypothetical protein